MKPFFRMTALVLGLALAGGMSASAKQHKMKAATHKMKAAATMKCPACGMMMSMKKTAGAPVSMKMGKATYYCCKGGCAAKMAKMHKMHMKMGSKHHKMSSKHHKMSGKMGHMKMNKKSKA